MTALSARVINQFCVLCNWAHQACQVHKTLFDGNPDADKINKSRFGYGYGVLSGITLEYTLLQIAKLHDKAVVSGKVTLSVDYILTYGGWDSDTYVKLEKLSMQLDSFAKKLRNARNQALSHNDLAAVLAGGVLGEFDKDEDVLYFERLREFADIALNKVSGDNFIYFPPVEEDIRTMASALSAAVDG